MTERASLPVARTRASVLARTLARNVRRNGSSGLGTGVPHAVLAQTARLSSSISLAHRCLRTFLRVGPRPRVFRRCCRYPMSLIQDMERLQAQMVRSSLERSILGLEAVRFVGMPPMVWLPWVL